MVGYGVTAKNDPSKMVQNNSVAIPEPLRAQPLQPKKELTLQEKQQDQDKDDSQNQCASRFKRQRRKIRKK